MRITQGTFSYLPDLTTDEVRAQVQYAIDQGWAEAVEFTDDPHPRNVLWEMWGLPMVEITDAAARRQRSPSSSPARRTSRASGSTARRQATARSGTPCTPTPPTSRPASVTPAATAATAATAVTAADELASAAARVGLRDAAARRGRGSRVPRPGE